MATCGAFFRLRLGSEEREHFEAAFLNTRHQLIAVERLFSGTVDGAE
ncbi:JAB domain-containing protein, partial [Stenotrophomonas maltophilia]